MSTAEKQRESLAPHWYKLFIRECPVCGRGDETRKRQFTHRPEDPTERVDYDGMAYDYCLER